MLKMNAKSAEVNSLLAVLADPKRAKKALEDIVNATQEYDKSLVSVNAAIKQMGDREVVMAAAEASHKDLTVRLNKRANDLSKAEDQLTEDIHAHSHNVQLVVDSQNTREDALTAKENDLANRERELKRLQAKAEKTLEEGQGLKRVYEGKLTRIQEAANG